MRNFKKREPSPLGNDDLRGDRRTPTRGQVWLVDFDPAVAQRNEIAEAVVLCVGAFMSWYISPWA